MKIAHKIAEALKLHAFSCSMIAVTLVFILSLGAYNADLFVVPNNELNVLHNLPDVTHANSLSLEPTNPVENTNKLNISSGVDRQEKCNIFEGNWIYDPEGSPLYDSAQCPFLGEQVSCQRNGRPDFEYEKWTWEAKGCDIPRKNIGKLMLGKLRHKRLIVVGDSLNRNQWESLACLLYSASSPSKARVHADSGSYKVFRSKEYNCTVEFYWSPFLVQDSVNTSSGDRILNLDKLNPSSSKWKGADYMVFNTGHWWAHSPKHKSWDGKEKVVEIETKSALAQAMDTWSRWIDENVDAKKTGVFFRSISPEHKGKYWCYNQTQPIMDGSFTVKYQEIRQIVEPKIQGMKTPVTYLNITELSNYRKDGHPSIYKKKQGKILVAMNKLRPETFSDCSHWCLPGVPDTWNRLLFACMSSETPKSVTIS